GLWSFATVTVLLATFNLFLPDKPNHIMLPSALVFGGLAQFIAGYMALFRNNTFGGTLFVSYGAFWAGSGLMMLPSVSSTLDAYGSAHDLAIATGIYKLFWSFFSLMNVCISLKVQGGNFMLTWCVSFVFLTLLFEGFGALFSLIPLIRVSGVTAYLAGLGAYYLGIVDLFEEQGVHLWMGVYKH
ncbi:GPR1/FUN34/yaaH family-domain-containing protein, partial [Radiomyces spectabilis]|uniref:GPR1/FUN34/yaaH family-domain-containing protein n=1 Tax=Radiomyces spectabilis TaxID=64574 RepID=UPI00221E958B